MHLDKFTDLAGTGTIRPGTPFKMALAGSIGPDATGAASLVFSDTGPLGTSKHERNIRQRRHLPCVATGLTGRDVAMPTRLRRLKVARPKGWEPSGKRLSRMFTEQLGTENDAFDLWLRRSLHSAFDAIAAEPIPQDILRMIEDDRAERERIRCRRSKRDE